MLEEATQLVAERYGKFATQVSDNGVALKFNSDGCAPQTKTDAPHLAGRLYTTQQLIDLPEPVVGASIGCGNPIEYAEIRHGDTVLDLGSGGGIDCFIAAKSVGATGHVIGVDATPEMVALANRNKAQMGVSNVEFRLGNIEALPVESQTIDVIVSNCVIDISADKPSVFQETFRVLKNGGRMAISDTVVLGTLPPKLKQNVDLWAGAVITPLISLTEFVQHIVDAGFVDVTVKTLTSYGLENFEQLDAESQRVLTDGYDWEPLSDDCGLFSATIVARKPQ